MSKLDLHRILVQDVFPAVRAHQIVARVALPCCKTCGHDKAETLARERNQSGYIFTCVQDVRSYLKGGQDCIFIYFGTAKPADNDSVALNIARIAVKASRKAWLKVEWNGSPSRAIVVKARNHSAR